MDSMNWHLYPTKENASHELFSNGLAVGKVKYSYEYEGEIFRHMELPYGMYVCLVGKFLSFEFPDASIYSVKRESTKLRELNNKLDSLLKEGKDISDFQWPDTCSSFEIREGKVKHVAVSPNCPNNN
ncbi:MAG: hypothetical protein LBH25_13155 [Fibromonadaceae bacterium]|jgi:hypothetical protein|nr:hypothetical protein [Fibromonadaceae bacterium]